MNKQFVDRIIAKKRSGSAIEDPEQFTAQMLERLCKYDRKGNGSNKMSQKSQRGNQSKVSDYDNDGY